MRTKDRVLCLDCGVPVERVHWEWCRSCYKRRHPPTIWPPKQCARDGCSKMFTPSGVSAGMQRYCGPVVVDGVLKHVCRDTADRVRKRAARKACGPAEPRTTCGYCRRRRVLRYTRFGVSRLEDRYVADLKYCGVVCFFASLAAPDDLMPGLDGKGYDLVKTIAADPDVVARIAEMIEDGESIAAYIGLEPDRKHHGEDDWLDDYYGDDEDDY